MPRLAPVRPRVFVKVIESNGLREVPRRGKGSHDFYQHPDDERRSVTVPNYDVIDPDLLAMMIREVGKSRVEYQRVLSKVK
jgi:predicted RNA binding protein YcfA (HicA-like mRNA interferase family)